MVEQSLIDYIKKNMNQYSPDQIRQSLAQSGWDQEAIDEAFRQVSPAAPAAPPAPAPVNQGMGVQDSGRPRLVLRPRIIAGIFPKFFGTLVFVIIFFFVFNPAVLLVFLGIDPVVILILTGSLIIFISVFFSYMNLRAREYRFFDDRSEFYEGFLNITRKVVRYDRITDITFNRSVWERIWGTGTVKLNTAGSPYKEIRIAYVRDSERIYQDVQNLVKSSQHGMTGTESYHRR